MMNLYPDMILFLAGGMCGLIAVAFGVYLLISGKNSKVYREMLQQETEAFSTIITTALLTEQARMSEKAIASEQMDDKTAILTEYADQTMLLADDEATSLLTEEDATEVAEEPENVIVDFNTAVLEGRYVLKSEIHGGGMSRIFLAENVKLGNRWIIKFISNKNGALANEENILKLLNHINLPKIVDIFHDENGVYLVESFIEGVSMDKVLGSGQKLTQTIILEWAEQLSQVLSYLHKMSPHPIYHFDLKPSNIMVTHDNKLVLIDFGISKRFGEDNMTALGVTYAYAAPEQLTHRIPEKYSQMIENRFGMLPEERFSWSPDARTDIYSLGVILAEMAIGQIIADERKRALKDAVSEELNKVITKCIETDPLDRYQSVDELLADLQKCKGSKIKMAHSLFLRKAAAIITVVSVVGSGGSLAGGYYIYAQENGALLDIDADVVIVSSQQTTELTIEKKMPNGKVAILDPAQITWKSSQSNIAQIDGSRILGMNAGTTTLQGTYRNKEISLAVKVVEPMDGIIDIAQRYQTGHVAQVFAGTQEREHRDGALMSAAFVGPESIDVADDGTIYITDSGYLRTIKDGEVGSIDFHPPFLTPRLVRCLQNDVYILTNEWEEEDGIYYGIIKLGVDGAEGIYLADAIYTAIEDFVFGTDGFIYFIERNAGVGTTELKMLDTASGEIEVLCLLPAGTASITGDGQNTLYLANPETGLIQSYRDDTLINFAGVENERAFIDGMAPLFYMPQKIKYADGSLFVWDFNTLRQIIIENSVVAEAITLAGEASPDFDLTLTKTSEAAEDIILPNSKLTDFLVIGGGVLLTDPKRSVVWEVR